MLFLSLIFSLFIVSNGTTFCSQVPKHIITAEDIDFTLLLSNPDLTQSILGFINEKENTLSMSGPNITFPSPIKLSHEQIKNYQLTLKDAIEIGFINEKENTLSMSGPNITFLSPIKLSHEQIKNYQLTLKDAIETCPDKKEYHMLSHVLLKQGERTERVTCIIPKIISNNIPDIAEYSEKSRTWYWKPAALLALLLFVSYSYITKK